MPVIMYRPAQSPSKKAQHPSLGLRLHRWPLLTLPALVQAKPHRWPWTQTPSSVQPLFLEAIFSNTFPSTPATDNPSILHFATFRWAISSFLFSPYLLSIIIDTLYEQVLGWYPLFVCAFIHTHFSVLPEKGLIVSTMDTRTISYSQILVCKYYNYPIVIPRTFCRHGWLWSWSNYKLNLEELVTTRKELLKESFKHVNSRSQHTGAKAGQTWASK